MKKIKTKIPLSQYDKVALLVDKMPLVSKKIKNTEIYKTYIPEKSVEKIIPIISIKDPITEEEEEEIKAMPLKIIKEEEKPIEQFNSTGNTSIEKDIIISDNKAPSDLIQSLTMLLDDKNIKGKTILDNRQVTAITLMNRFGQVYGIPFLIDFVNEWCRYRISGDSGKGRADLISIASAIQLQQNKEFEQYREMLRK